jgi:hypothetical protein
MNLTGNKEPGTTKEETMMKYLRDPFLGDKRGSFNGP